MAVAKHAQTPSGLGFPAGFEGTRPSLMRTTLCYISSLTRKTTISPNRRSMSDAKQSADPLEAGQAKPERHRRARAFARLQGHPGAGARAVFHGRRASISACAMSSCRKSMRSGRASSISSPTKLHAQLHIGRLTRALDRLPAGVRRRQPAHRCRRWRGQAALRAARQRDASRGVRVFRLAPVLSNLTVDGPDVLISRAADGSLRVAGVPSRRNAPATTRFTTWLLRQQAIVLRDGTLRWRDAERDAPEIALQAPPARDPQRRLPDHRLALQAPADGELLHGPLDFRAHFRHQPFAAIGMPINWTGRPTCRPARSTCRRSRAM